VLPDAASGQGPGTPPEAGPESCHAAPRRSEAKSGVQGGEACPAGAKHMRGRTFCRPGTNFIEHYACRAAPRRSEAKAWVQVLSELRIYPRLQSWLQALAPL